MSTPTRFLDFESQPVDEHLLVSDGVCMGCDRPFEEGQHIVSRVVSVEPDRPDDLAETAGELVCVECFMEGLG